MPKFVAVVHVSRPDANSTEHRFTSLRRAEAFAALLRKSKPTYTVFVARISRLNLNLL